MLEYLLGHWKDLELLYLCFDHLQSQLSTRVLENP